jgi:hypothetical protein
MLEKGFLKNQPHDKGGHRNIASVISAILMYLGALILIVSFGYLLLNMDQSDKLIGLIFPFLIAGLGLIIVSQLIKRTFNRLRK